MSAGSTLLLLGSRRFSPRSLPGTTAWWSARDPSRVLNADGDPASYLDPVATLVEPLQGWNATQTVAESRPLYLRNDGEGYLHLPGVSGNITIIPDSAAISITGDIEIEVCAALNSWTTGVQGVVAKTIGAETHSYAVLLRSTGVSLRASLTGTDNTEYGPGVPVPFSAFEKGWIKVTRVAASGIIKIYTSYDGVSYTQLGSDVTSTSGNLFDSTAPLGLGTTLASGVGNDRLTGRIFRVIIRDGIDGPVAFDFDANKVADSATSFTESSPNAATVTINSTGNNPAQIVRTSKLLFDGANDFFSLPASSLGLFRNVGFGWGAAGCRYLSTTTTGALWDWGNPVGATRFTLNANSSNGLFRLQTRRLDADSVASFVSSDSHSTQNTVVVALADFAQGQRTIRQKGVSNSATPPVQGQGLTSDTNSGSALLGRAAVGVYFSGTITDLLAGNADPGAQLPKLEKFLAQPLIDIANQYGTYHPQADWVLALDPDTQAYLAAIVANGGEI